LWGKDTPIENLREAPTDQALRRIWDWLGDSPSFERSEGDPYLDLPFPTSQPVPEHLREQTQTAPPVIDELMAEEAAYQGRDLTNADRAYVVSVEVPRVFDDTVGAPSAERMKRVHSEARQLLQDSPWVAGWLDRNPMMQIALLILGDLYPQLALVLSSDPNVSLNSDLLGADRTSATFQGISIHIADVGAVTPDDIAGVVRAIRGKRPRPLSYKAERLALVELALIVDEHRRRIETGEALECDWRPSLSALKAAWTVQHDDPLRDSEVYRWLPRFPRALYSAALEIG
jgi:hypothetical protein